MKVRFFATLVLAVCSLLFWLWIPKQSPENDTWLLDAARTAALLSQSVDEDALAQAVRLTTKYPEKPNAWVLRGRLNLAAKQVEDAQQSFAKAATLDPESVPAVLGQALCAVETEQWVAAQSILDRMPVENHWTLAHWQIRLAVILNDAYRIRQFAQQLPRHQPEWLYYATHAYAAAATDQWSRASEIQQRALIAARETKQNALTQVLLPQMQTYLKQDSAALSWPDAGVDYLEKAAVQPPRPTTPISDVQSRRSHDNMLQRLAQIPAQIDPLETTYRNRQRAEALAKELASSDDINTFLALQPKLAQEQLRAGQTQAAIESFQKLQSVIERGGIRFEGEQKSWLLHRQALAYLRLGEQQNCILNHTSASCILPIRAAGQHQLKNGSRKAMQAYESVLASFPNDLTARWLLNIAAMTLGEHPQAVDESWLIPQQAFTPDHDFPLFRDRAKDLGIDVRALSGGSIIDDFNGDDHLDIFVTSWGLEDPVHFFVNQGDGRFVDNTEAAGLTGIYGGLNAMQTDFDNDGDLDIFILRGAWMAQQGEQPNSLLRNDGDGSFTDITQAAGLLSFYPTQAAVWFDFNNDGWLDVFIGNESDRGNIYPCQLYRNNGDNTFTDVAAQAGVDAVGFVKGVTAGDIDNDGRMDLYISCYSQPNRLFRNIGPSANSSPDIFRFKDITEQAGVTEPVISFPTWFWDIDNDGDLDLLVLDYENRNFDWVVADRLQQDHPGQRTRLYRNLGDGKFEDISESSGFNKVFLAMGSNFGDIDFDGFPDAYIGTGAPNLRTLLPNALMHNQGDGTFKDVTGSSGFGHLQKGHGVSFADIDHDGDQDLHIVMGGAYQGDVYQNALFENPGITNGWLKLKLEGRQANRAAVGARIKVRVSTQKRFRDIHYVVNSGGSFGASPMRAEIGLGKAESIDWVHIQWPGSGQQRFTTIEPNRYYHIIEGAQLPQPLAHQSTPFAANTRNHGRHH